MFNEKELLSMEYIDGMTIDIKPSGMKVDRPIYRQSQVNVTGHYEKPKIRRVVSQMRLASKSWSCKRCLFSFLPLLVWLPKYSVKTQLVSDIISGITVAVMHIPQGIGYALLANVSPIVGIYMAFFPVLIYIIFATSRHNSMGTFAVVCLMTGKVVEEYSSELPHQTMNGSWISGEEFAKQIGYSYTSIEIATAVTFLVACFQVVFYLLRMGKMTSIMSETMVNAFTTASAIHVVISQLKDLLGLKIHKHVGLFRTVYTVIDVILALPAANVTAIIISAIAVAIMIFNNEVLKPIVSKKTKFPIPIEMLAVVLGIIVSKFMYLETEYGLTVVGDVPTGFPVPKLPTVGLFQLIYIDAFLICVVSYCISISMAMLFAEKANYEIDANQELLAMGVGNAVGSLFMCLPISASLSRSLIQYLVGGKTQIASVVSCICLCFVLLWIGPYFHPLPRCILASIIVVALKGMLWQCKSVVRFWKLSKWDAAVWIGTVLVTVFVDISLGLLTGIVLSVASILVQSLNPYSCLLANLPKTDLYLDQYRFKETQEMEGIKIYHYSGSLNFSARSTFRNELAKHIEFNVTKKLVERSEAAEARSRTKSRRQRKRQDGADAENGGAMSQNHHQGEQEQLQQQDNNQKEEQRNAINGSTGNNHVLQEQEERYSPPFRILILDFSSITYIDPAGVEFLRQLAQEFVKFDVDLYIAAATSPICEMFLKCDTLDKKSSPYTKFPTIHDAVLSAQMALKSK